MTPIPGTSLQRYQATSIPFLKSWIRPRTKEKQLQLFWTPKDTFILFIYIETGFKLTLAFSGRNNYVVFWLHLPGTIS